MDLDPDDLSDIAPRIFGIYHAKTCNGALDIMRVGRIPAQTIDNLNTEL
jgi:hypothetical protein